MGFGHPWILGWAYPYCLFGLMDGELFFCLVRWMRVDGMTIVD
jgi:hypothetical protein